MKKLTYTTAIFMAMTATTVFAHHPASSVVDADTYEMIEENVGDTPHADMVVDDMGSATGEDMGSITMDQASTEQAGPLSNMAGVEVDVDAQMEVAETVDTMDLIENVENSLAQ